MHRIALVSLIVISFLPLRVAFAQTMGTETQVTSPTSQTPAQGTQTSPQGAVSQPGQVINPPYFPQVNLDNFELSTLGGKGLGERKQGSTLGGGAKQKSNAEVNKPREKKETEIETNNATAGEEETPQANSEEPTEPLSPALTKSSGLYTWKDKSGVVHVTNNIGSVPAEYQDQTINKPENSKGKESPEPSEESEQQ